MADIESNLENEEKLTDDELEQVAGGTRYYDAEIYEQYGIVTMDDGKTFLYGNHEITEQQAASITFYSLQFLPEEVKAARKKGFKHFLQITTAYRLANKTQFKSSYTELNSSTAATADIK